MKIRLMFTKCQVSDISDGDVVISKQMLCGSGSGDLSDEDVVAAEKKLQLVKL